MVREAKVICEKLGQNTYVKVPTTREGLKAMKALSKEGIKITATAIYTPMQAYLAGKAGADYAAPYVNRIDNLGANGVEAAKKIHDIFKNNGLKTEVLAAFGAHIFFDDQDIHTEPASAVVPAATVPYRDGDNPKE